MARKLILLVAGCAALYVGSFAAVFDVEHRKGAVGNDGATTTVPRSVIGPLYRRDCDDWLCRYCSTSTLHKIFCPLNAIWAKCCFDLKSGFIIDVTKYN